MVSTFVHVSSCVLLPIVYSFLSCAPARRFTFPIFSHTAHFSAGRKVGKQISSPRFGGYIDMSHNENVLQIICPSVCLSAHPPRWGRRVEASQGREQRQVWYPGWSHTRTRTRQQIQRRKKKQTFAHTCCFVCFKERLQGVVRGGFRGRRRVVSGWFPVVSDGFLLSFEFERIKQRKQKHITSSMFCKQSHYPGRQWHAAWQGGFLRPRNPLIYY